MLRSTGVLALLGLLFLSACSGLPPAWRGSEPRAVDVLQVGAAEDCATPEAEARILRFATGEALRAWAGERNRHRLAAEAQPGRPYAVVELGRDAAARGLAVAREAQLTGRDLRLSGSLFRAGRRGEQVAPCVVLALPSGEGIRIDRIALFDSAGTLIASSHSD